MERDKSARNIRGYRPDNWTLEDEDWGTSSGAATVVGGSGEEHGRTDGQVQSQWTGTRTLRRKEDAQAQTTRVNGVMKANATTRDARPAAEKKKKKVRIAP